MKKLELWKIVVFIGIVAVGGTVLRTFVPLLSQTGILIDIATDRPIVIVPMTGIPSTFMQALKLELEEHHNTDILVTMALAKGDEMLMPDQGQFDASYLAGAGLEVGRRIGREDAFLIVLTNEDINYPDSGLAYVYSAFYESVSVVSLARINDMTFGYLSRVIAVPAMFNDLQDNTLKLINLAIRYGLHGYEASPNMEGDKYNPILSVDDVRRVNACYP